jgi:PPM family protein phosphatase
MTLALHYALQSDVGLLREGNEDSAYAGPRLLAIADGMGGHAAGEVASAVAISAIAPLDAKGLTEPAEMLDALAAAVASARGTLHDMSLADPATEGMGTTLTALLWSGDQVAICHIGDSRAYLLRNKNLYQITTDHTLIQSLVDEGRLSQEAAASHPQRSLIMRALQGSTDSDPDLTMHEALLGDRYLLCSDGLTDVVSDQAVFETLMEVPDADEAVARLIEQAIENGGPDNITCIIADVTDSVSGPLAVTRGHELAGAAANPDARSLLASKAAAAAAPVAGAEQANVNGHRGRTAAAADADLPDGGRARRRWPLVTSIVAVLVLLVVGGLVVGWQIIQGEYYVALDGSQVVIYRGVSDEIAGLHLSSVYKRYPNLTATAVPSDLQLPTSPGSLAKAQQTVTTIQRTVTCTQVQHARTAWSRQDAAYRAALAHWTTLYSHPKKGTKVPPKPKPPAAEPVLPTYCAAVGVG